ncbi:hypothetical protein [Actinomadura keratinilytica]|jgi:hypothetical protein|uniref:Uncharacterized protein n=1 Tax=Actinomadura keratinilytica TaxID=547461 RepID=A0ABP7YKP1_9ACTN
MPAADLTDPATSTAHPQDRIPSVREQGPDWRQVNLYFADWENAEHAVAVRLVLEDVTGTSGAWCFIRSYPV